MKKKITILALIVFIASALSAFSREKYHGKQGGYNYGNNNRSHYYGYRGGHHHNDGLEFAVGVARGLFLGSALTFSATRPPFQTVVYGTPYTTIYQRQVVVRQPVVQQPTICVEDRIVNGQSQIKQNDGSKVWRSSRYPIIQRVQVPCYEEMIDY